MGLDNPVHIIFIVVILLLLFGARRLPEIGRSLGTGMREFKQSLTGEDQHQQAAPTLAAGSNPAQPVQGSAAQPGAPQPAATPPPATQSPAAPAQAAQEPVEPATESPPAPAESSPAAPQG